MKIAVLSDIHANIPALQAVADHVEKWRPDRVVVNGDIINRGPCPQACLHFVWEKHRSQDWHLIAGNHEGYVLGHVETPIPTNGRLAEINRPSYWTYQQLNGNLQAIATLPPALQWQAPDHSQIRICHASMRSNRDGIHPHTAVTEIRQQIAPAPALFCTGHTHIPFVRQVDETLLVNAGSVGSPCDGDTRASYAQIRWHRGQWQAHIIRVPYDQAQTARDFVTAGFHEGNGPIARLIYPEWVTATAYVTPWIQQYQAAVLAGHLSLDESVTRFLTHHTSLI